MKSNENFEKFQFILSVYCYMFEKFQFILSVYCYIHLIIILFFFFKDMTYQSKTWSDLLEIPRSQNWNINLIQVHN